MEILVKSLRENLSLIKKKCHAHSSHVSYIDEVESDKNMKKKLKRKKSELS